MTEEWKDRFLEFIKDRRTQKIIFVIVMTLIFVIVIIVFLTPSKKYETKFIDAAKKYVQKYNITSDKFISLYDLETSGLLTSKGCNKGTGIYYRNNEYETYLECNDFYSDSIKKLETTSKYITILGEAFIITNTPTFTDPGYTFDQSKYKVEVVNTYQATPGLYQITYIVRDDSGKRLDELKRFVLYSEYNANYDSAKITLYGKNPTYVLKNNNYIEPGYSAVNKDGENIKSNVEVIGKVEITKPGTYTLTYKLNQIQVTRQVIVSDLTGVIVADVDAGYTKEPIEIYVSITGIDYKYTILPDGNKSTNKYVTYQATTNGIYKFIVNDKYGNQLLLSKEVTNFDNVIPTGTCEATLNEGITSIKVTAQDNQSGIAGYAYNNGSSTTAFVTSNTYQYTGLYNNVSVKIKDKTGNIAEITCNKIGDGSFAQIKAPSGANIIKSDDSESLKVSIEKASGHYITRVWVRDPYNQMNKGVIANWGVERETPYKILSREITTKGLQNKILVGINASGFYVLGTWSPNSQSYNEQYNITTEGPLVITNGQVIRNWYYDAAVDRSRNHAIYTMDSNGNLVTYPNFNGLTESARKSLFETIINSNYRNTWVFRPVIFQNGKLVDSSILGSFMSGNGKRTVLCQINTNNFAMISTTGDYNVNGIAKILTNLGCQTAVNMDGGGSVGLLYKGKNGSLETITGGSRAVVDTLYFTEK